MAPPEGVVADLADPTDVLWTINLVTQALTLTFCSGFVLIRGVQKFRMATTIFSVDDCELKLLQGNVAEKSIRIDWLTQPCRPHGALVAIPGCVLHLRSVLYVSGYSGERACAYTD